MIKVGRSPRIIEVVGMDKCEKEEVSPEQGGQATDLGMQFCEDRSTGF